MNAESQPHSSISARLERLPVTGYQKGIFFVIATAWIFDAMDIGSMSFVLGSIRAEFHLSSAQAGLLGSASFLGMFVGAAGAGLLADRFGRRSVFQWSMLIWGFASFLCAAAPNVHWLLLVRVLLGLGMGMELPVAQALLSEFIPARHRGRYGALLEGCWPVGFIASGVLAYVFLPLWTWRGVFAALGVPSLFVLIVRTIVPESPRWLESRGRHEAASLVMSSFERHAASTVVKRRDVAGLTPNHSQAVALTSQWSELWRGRYARRTLMLWLLWFFALLGFYGLTTWLSALLQQSGFAMTQSVLYTVLISAAGVPGFLTVAWLVERWGRKPTCLATLLGAACMTYFYGRVAGGGGSPAQFIPLGLGMQFCTFGMWSVLYAYTPELYPTRCRATGSGFASSVGRVGSLLGPLIVGLSLPVTGQLGVFTMGAVCFVLAAIVVWTLGVETKGQTLEQLSP